MIEVERTQEEQDMDRLIDEHWKFIKELLAAHGEQDIKKIEFHYRAAFAHGWKHYKEYKGELK